MTTYADPFQRGRLVLPMTDWEWFANNYVDYRYGTYPWRIVGNWTVVDDYPFPETHPPSTNTYSAYLYPSSSADVSLWTAWPGQGQGLTARWVNAQNWLALVNIGGVATLRQCLGGTVSALGTVPTSPLAPEDRQLHLSVYGNSVLAYVGTLASTGAGRSIQVRLTGSPTGTSHGLISYGNGSALTQLSVNVDDTWAIDVGNSATVDTGVDLTDQLNFQCPPGTKHNDFLIATIVSSGPGAIIAPSGWTVQVQRSDTGTASATEVSIAVLTRFWRVGQPTSWTAASTPARSHVLGITSYGGVDFQTPVEFLEVGADTNHNSLAPVEPYWHVPTLSAGPERLYVGAMAMANADSPRVPPAGATARTGWVMPHTDWDTSSGSGASAISGWGWTQRQINDLTYHPPHLDAWLTVNLGLLPRATLGSPRSRRNTNQIRTRPVQNYISAVTKHSPSAFWPLDDSDRPDGLTPIFQPEAGTDTPTQTPATTTPSSGFIARGGTNAAKAATLVVTRDAASRDGILGGYSRPPGTYDATHGFSLEAWLRPIAAVNSPPAYVGFTNQDNPYPQDGSHHGFRIRQTSNDSTWEGFIPNDPQFAPSSIHIPTGVVGAENTLYHIVFVHSASGSTQMYINGAAAGAPVTPPPYLPRDLDNFTCNLLIGGHAVVGFVALYPTALTTAQINEHYRAGTERTVLSAVRARAHTVHLVEQHDPTLDGTRGVGHASPFFTRVIPQLGITHGSAHALPFIPVAGPGALVSKGRIQRINSWSGIVNGAVNLPFRILNDDRLLIVARALDGWRARADIGVAGFQIGQEYPWDAQTDNTIWALSDEPATGLYRVGNVTGPPVIATPDTVTVWVGLVVYRGTDQNSGSDSWMAWIGSPPDTLDGTFQSLDISSPDATGICVRVLGVGLRPPLDIVDWPEYDTGQVDEIVHWTSPAGDPNNGDNVRPGESLRITITDKAAATPTDEQHATSEGPWDDNYYSIPFGSGLLTVLILVTSDIPDLDADPFNPAPVGAGRLPIGGVTETPLGIVDETGSQIVDEDGNTLIWS